ncbi:MAG: hypothetical protein SFV19_15585 [Rhodospirillaceae bacterium]|nr:hypothetical protein [Rhodospirillaceae bacterium]
MIESEQEKIDKFESSGLLPALRNRVRSFCAPLWWEVGGQTILANATMCVVKTPTTLFGVTNEHVLKIYEKQKAENEDIFCQLGGGPFNLAENLLSRSQQWDLATFRIPEITLKHWGGSVFVSEAWPPKPIRKGDTVMLGGFPENRRTTTCGTRPKVVFNDFVSFLAKADNSSDDHMSFCFDSSSWYWPQGTELEAHPNLSGASGGPCFRLVAESESIELAGFICEAGQNYEIIRVRQASLISAEGLIQLSPI